MQISAVYGITAEAFYVPIKGDAGPPSGNAYGHFKKTKKHEWYKIQLSDADVVNFVNLRFMSEHYGYSPNDVIKMRAGGKNFKQINHHVKAKNQKAKKAHKKAAKAKEKKKGKGKGKGKGN